jgi:hypothetical protein
MPDSLPRLPVLAQAYDAAYAACSREIARLSPRRQSDEILRAVARFCLTQAEAGRTCDDIAEAKLVGVLAAAAADPFTLTRFIADMNAQSADADFPAAALDPRNRHGWAHPQVGNAPRIISRPPWQQSTDESLDELRRYTCGLRGERLHAQLAANIEASTEAFIVPENPGIDPRPHHMMPVTAAAYYLLCFEQRIRDLETALEEEGRSHYAGR